MKPLVPVLAAGSTFAGLALSGLGLGAWAGQRWGHPLWALAGLFAGLALGCYAALRLLQRSMR